MRRSARFGPRVLWAIALAFDITFLLLVAFQREGGILAYGLDPVTVLYSFFLMAFPTVGAVVASRRPDNVIGWLFCVTGVLGALGFAAQLYADRVLVASPGSGPAGELAAWLSAWAIPMGLFVGPIFLLFLFPDGSPGMGWWRRTFKIAVAVFLVTFAGFLFAPDTVQPFDDITNPVGIAGPLGEVLRVMKNVFMIEPLVLFPIGIVFVVARFRSSRGTRRQQMKWFAYPAAAMGAVFMVSFLFSTLGQELLSDIFFLIGFLLLVSVPVCSAVAILRYRLYDIDVIINRTLVYGSLTAILVGIYLAIIFLMQALLSPLTKDSDLAIAASTLGVAGLFRPLRGRVQDLINRRFYRRRYDAARALDALARRTRDEIELDLVRTDVMDVLAETVQPAHFSLLLIKETQ